MAKQKTKGKYLPNAILICVLGLVLMFLSGLSSEHINIIETFITEEGGGWSATSLQAPITAGNVACIFLTFIYGTLFVKYGVKKPLMITSIITAIGVFGIVAANGLDCNGGTESGNYIMMFISLMVVRCGCMMFQMGTFQLVANWFIRFRGQAMGIVTIGPPLFSVIGTATMSKLIQKFWGGDYRPFYSALGIIILVAFVLIWLLIREYPEDVGLYPDGADHSPLSEKGMQEENLTVKEVLTDKKAWQVIISYICLLFVLNSAMGSMAVRFIMLGGTELWLSQGTTFLAIGAACGLVMSYVFGLLDDKFGSIVPSIILIFCELAVVLALMFMPASGSTPLFVLWAAGIACITGGVPTMNPCIVTYVFGRRKYQSANRIIMAIQCIPTTFGALLLTSLISSGKSNAAYTLLLVLLAVGLITFITMLKIPDANKEDRMYAEAQKNK